MRFPNRLKRRQRPVLKEKCIASIHYMYARHPKSFFDIESGLPFFERIRSKQSFNWSAFSIPVWVRFNDVMEYKVDNGVVRYSTRTIRYAHKIDNDLPSNSYGLKHIPLDNNYSHCELYPINISHKQKRAFRMTLRHKCRTIIKPGEDRPRIKLILDLLQMRFHQFIVLIKINRTSQDF